MIPGQSSLNINLGPITLSAATHNLWTGPGVFNSLILSNNAEGFKHLSFRTNKPLKTNLGNFELNLISGKLNYKQNQINEVWMSNLFYPKNYPNETYYGTNKPYPSHRYFNQLTFVYSPIFLPNSSWGFQRSFQNYLPATTNSNLNFINEFFPVLNGIFRNSYTDDDFPRDQKLVIFSKFGFPKNNFQVYFEFAYNDGVANFRDLLLRSQRSSAYIFGFNKYYQFNKNYYLSINFETVRLAELPNYLVSYAGTIYQHGLILEGYTNNEQIIGAGVGNGNNAQQFSFNIHKGINKLGFRFEHINQGPINYAGDFYSLGIRSILWDDYLYGFEGNFKILNNIVLKSQINFINSRNYLWIKDNKHFNLFLLMNLIYLW
jgi:hypothetical protein